MFGCKRAYTGAVMPPPGKKTMLVHANDRDPVTGATVVVAPNHIVKMSTRPVWTQTIMTPKPNTPALDNTAYFSFILENNSPGAIEDATLRFEIKFAATGTPTDSRVLPVTHWFERIEFYERLSGQELARYYGDVLHMLMNTLSQEALASINDMLNQNMYCRLSSRVWSSGDVQWFYLPIVHLLLNGLQIDSSHLKGDLEVRFYPRGSIFVEDQTTQTVPCTATLEEVRLISSSTIMPNCLLVGKHPDKIGKTLRHQYLDYVQFIDHGKVMQPSSRVTVDLDQFNHRSGALFVYLRRSGLQTGYSAGTITYNPDRAYEATGRLLKCEALGDTATIDLEDVQGRSQLGQGTPVNERYFREHTANELFNEIFANSNNTYVIPFSNDLRGMLDCEMDGYKHFVRARERLVFNTAAAPTETTLELAPSISITITSTNLMTFRYEGVIVAIADVDEDKTLASINFSTWHYEMHATGAWTVINTLLARNSYLKSKGIKISLASKTGTAANVQAGTIVVTVTFTDLNDQPLICGKDDLLKFTITLDDQSLAERLGGQEYLPRTYTPGKRGFRSGVDSSSHRVGLHSLRLSTNLKKTWPYQPPSAPAVAVAAMSVWCSDNTLGSDDPGDPMEAHVQDLDLML
eukprot:g29935.t1